MLRATHNARGRRTLAPSMGVGLVLLSLLPAASGGATPAAQPSPCPPRAISQVAPNGWSAARRELAPQNPVAMRLCRYLGRNTALPLGLARSRLLNQPALLARLVDELDTLPPFPRVPLFCPLDDGSQVLALLAYPGGERATVPSIGLAVAV